jgi:hypothetical protein
MEKTKRTDKTIIASMERLRKNFIIITSATFIYGALAKINPICSAGILITILTAKKARRIYFHARAIESSTRNGHIFLGRAKGMIMATIIRGKINFMSGDLNESKLIISRSIKATIGVEIKLRPHVSFTGNASTQYLTPLLNLDFIQSPNLHAHSDIVPTGHIQLQKPL